MKENIIFAKHILESVEIIEEYCSGSEKEDFLKDKKLQDAVIRRIEIIGEAVKNIDNSFKDANSDIEWKKIAGMRDIIIHKYFGVDLELVWNAIVDELPVLKKEIEKILKK